jgi:hypothetical protein
MRQQRSHFVPSARVTVTPRESDGAAAADPALDPDT